MIALVAFVLFVLGAVEELTKGDWGILTPLSFCLMGLALLALNVGAPHLTIRRQ